MEIRLTDSLIVIRVPVNDELKWIKENVPSLRIPRNFKVTVSTYNPNDKRRSEAKVPGLYFFLLLSW